MKPGRQTVIIDIISQQNIETQQQLMDALAERGVKSTQATLSRDIHDLRLIKEPGPDGRARYVRPAEVENSKADETLRSILRQSVISSEAAQNIIVVKTFPGLASAVCAAIDGMKIDGLVGTLAGDDTAFIAMKTSDLSENLVSRFHELV